MKSILFFAFLLLTSVFCVDAQVPEQETRWQLSELPEVGGENTKRGLPREPSSAKSTGDHNSPQVNGYTRPDANTRLKRYLNSMFGPAALGQQIARSGFATWQNSPEEWGPHWDGFGRRVASSVAKNVIRQTAIYGLDGAFKLDSHFYRSKKKDLGSRLTNALISPVTARNAKGKRVIGFPRIVATYSSSIIAAETWYPQRFDYKDGLRNGTFSLGLNAGFFLIKEFIWKK
jgi:hypothetical protein